MGNDVGKAENRALGPSTDNGSVSQDEDEQIGGMTKFNNTVRENIVSTFYILGLVMIIINHVH
jgi:hypothetical protein